MRLGWLRRGVLGALVAAAALIGPATFAGGAPAQDDACALSIDHEPVGATSAAHPVHIDVDRPTTFTVTTPPGAHEVIARLTVGPAHVTLPGFDGRMAGGTVEQTYTVSDHISYGVGLYQVTFSTETCTRTLWVALEGRSPLADPIGLGAAAVALAALAGTTVGLVGTHRGTRSGRLASTSAAVAGVAGNVVAMKSGIRPVTTQSLALSAMVPGLGTAALRRALQRMSSQGSSSAGAAPTTASPPVATSTAGATASAAPAPTSAPTAAPAMAGAGAHAPVAAEPPAGGRSEAPARFLQAEVRKVGASGRATKATKGFSPGAVHRVDVWVGSAVAEAIALATPFPDDQLPDTAAEHHLTVALTEASLPHPLQQEITLPATGDSTRAQLELPVPADAKLVDARIVVALDNRILQTARLRGPVRSRFRTGDRIELVEEALVRRDLNDLSGRSQFDMAVVLDATTDGRPVATTLRNGVVENLMLDDGIHDTVVLMSERLTGLASDPDTKADLTSPATAELLCFLANHGAVLRDKLLEAQVADAAILDQRRLQLVSVHPDTFLPIEFIFDLPAPAVGAPICPNAAKALEAGECAGDCPGADEIPAKVVCPMGFWCFNRVVERHATTRERIDALGGRAEAGLECDPTEARGVLSPVSSSLLAFSKRVDAKEPKPSVGLEQVLDEVTSKHAATAGSWQEWIEIVERDAPSLLVLLSHTVEDDQLELPGLEIADGDRLLLSNLDTCHVRSSKAVCPPIVLLLGCETALTGGYEQFMTSFQEKGAGIVVGTLATVLGYQAAPVAGALVEAIRAAGEVPGVTFGDVLVATRRQLLAQGLPMSMVLTAYGDADWRLTQ